MEPTAALEMCSLIRDLLQQLCLEEFVINEGN
jgi:hypothetical protein